MGLFPSTLIVRNRCDDWTLLLFAVKGILIQSFLLLSNESFLERHCLVLLQIVHDLLNPDQLLMFLSNVKVGLIQLFLPFDDLLG